MFKRCFFLSLFMFVILNSKSQNKVNLIIFSEDSDPFYVFINGVQQNTKAEANIKFTDLSPNVSLRIKFEDIALPEIKKSMPLEANMEHTFRIKKDLNKQVKLRYFGGVPLSEAVSGIPTQSYHTAPEGDVSSSSNGNNTTVTSSTITSHNTNVNSNTGGTENVAININVAGVGMSMNATGMDQTSPSNMTSVTSTTLSSTSNTQYTGSDNTSTENSGNPVKTKSAACQMAMSQANFNKMKESIESKPFSETKMSTAKVATKNACLSVNQIKIITKLFTMDEDKLAYAKYAYASCVDKANYYQVGDVFSFSTSTEELNNFLTEN